MRRASPLRALLLTLALLAAPLTGPALAVQPDEVLDDPALEARARALSSGLRCLVCRNQSIDGSNAELARDLRILLRERLVAGDTDEEAVAYLVDRYGEYILLNPPARGSTLLLWVAGPAMLAAAGGAAFVYLRRRRGARDAQGEALTPEEEARLREILRS